MILRHGAEDDDIRFLCYFLDKSVVFEAGKPLELIEECGSFLGFDAVVEQIHKAHGEEFSPKVLAECRRARTDPRIIKGDAVTVLLLLNYIGLIAKMLKTGSLKDKEYIDQVTRMLKKDFDPDFYLLEIKTGKIGDIQSVEGMDKIFCEKVLSDREYTICSGLRDHCKEDELRGQTFLFVLNIKKAKFKHLESEGMICCASQSGIIEPIRMDQPINTRLEVEGAPNLFGGIQFEKVDMMKAKYKEALSGFQIIDNHLCFRGKRVLCGGECVKTVKVSNGPVS